jgi:hypothetical protein
MTKPADSLVLALINIGLIGVLYLGGSFAADVALGCMPALLLLTLIFALKDRKKAEMRIQSWIALVLAIANAALLLSIRF